MGETSRGAYVHVKKISLEQVKNGNESDLIQIFNKDDNEDDEAAIFKMPSGSFVCRLICFCNFFSHDFASLIFLVVFVIFRNF